MKRCLIGIALFFLLPAHDLFAQKTDVELWTGGSLNVKMSKHFSAEVEQVFKFNDTISHFKSAFSELGLRYKLNRYFSFGANYRFIENPPSKNAQRFSGDFYCNLKKKGFPLTLQYRLRFQHEIRFSNKNTEDYIRNRFRLDYNLCKLVDPYISFEPFFRLNGKNEFRVTRFAIGMDWRLIPNLHLNTFYMLQKDVNIKKPDTSHIIGLMLSYDLRTFEKTKKDKTKPSI